MFQLLEFLASHFGPAIVTVLQDTIYAAMALTDCDECGFNDLGKLLFGGLVVALIVGILISVLRRRVQGETQSSDFISIRPTNRNS
jgi:hypothetical protein